MSRVACVRAGGAGRHREWWWDASPALSSVISRSCVGRTGFKVHAWTRSFLSAFPTLDKGFLLFWKDVEWRRGVEGETSTIYCHSLSRVVRARPRRMSKGRHSQGPGTVESLTGGGGGRDTGIETGWDWL